MKRPKKMKEHETLIFNDNPEYFMSFHRDDDKEVGKLEWGTGKLVFTGDAEESAKLLFEFLKPCIDEYIVKKG